MHKKIILILVFLITLIIFPGNYEAKKTTPTTKVIEATTTKSTTTTTTSTTTTKRTRTTKTTTTVTHSIRTKTTTTVKIKSTAQVKETTTQINYNCPYSVKNQFELDVENITVSDLEYRKLFNNNNTGFNLEITGISENYFISIGNNKDGEKIYITYDDTKDTSGFYTGAYKIDLLDESVVKTYTISIKPESNIFEKNSELKELLEDYIKKIVPNYSNSTKEVQQNIFNKFKSKCTSTVIRTITVTTPMKNPWHDFDECDKMEDYFYCTEYTTNENLAKLTENEARKIIQTEEERRNQITTTYCQNCVSQKLIDMLKSDFWVQYGLIIIIVIILVILLDLAFIIYNVWKRKEMGKL